MSLKERGYLLQELVVRKKFHSSLQHNPHAKKMVSRLKERIDPDSKLWYINWYRELSPEKWDLLFEITGKAMDKPSVRKFDIEKIRKKSLTPILYRIDKIIQFIEKKYTKQIDNAAAVEPVAVEPVKESNTVAVEPVKESNAVAVEPVKESKAVTVEPVKESEVVTVEPVKESKAVAVEPVKESKVVAVQYGESNMHFIFFTILEEKVPLIYDDITGAIIDPFTYVTVGKTSAKSDKDNLQIKWEIQYPENLGFFKKYNNKRLFQLAETFQ